MSLQIGIVGLPNVGKSTTFNALSKAQNAEVASYPFTTIKPNRAIVPIPDKRVERLQKLTDRPNAIHTTIEFVDIAGLVKGASRGEGLGNQFLSNIRDVDLIVHIVRCFEDPNVAHISESINPRYDIEVVEIELILADLEQLDRKIDRLASQVKADRKTYEPQMKLAEELREHLDSGKTISQATNLDQGLIQLFNQELRFLTAKPVIYVVNVDEAGLEKESPCEQVAHSMAKERGVDSVKLCAKLEEEMIDLEETERREYLELVGVEESGLEKVVRLSYQRLGLISFFTMNENEVRAWTVQNGEKAPGAAGKIHTDFERGFIRAEVVPYQRFMELGSMNAVRTAGELRIEGKEYEVQDGDIIYFRFNV